jgi:hypothetical protein
MLTATETGKAEASAETAPPATSLVEMSDEEILSWLTTSILDEPDPSDVAPDAEPHTVEFWDRVATLQSMSELGYEGSSAVQRAIGLLGLEASLQGEGADGTESASRPITEEQLLKVHADLVERAGRAVALWATLQGSALRAATAGKS